MAPKTRLKKIRKLENKKISICVMAPKPGLSLVQKLDITFYQTACWYYIKNLFFQNEKNHDHFLLVCTEEIHVLHVKKLCRM